MKKLFLILTLLLTTFSCTSQEAFNIDYLTFQYSEALTTPLVHYFIHAEEAGLDITKFKNLKVIDIQEKIISQDGEHLAGVARWDDSHEAFYVYISFYTYVQGCAYTEMVLYHELWHVYLRDTTHCDEKDCLYILNTILNPEDSVYWGVGAIKEYF